MTLPVLLLATRNPGKVAELCDMLAGRPWRIQSLDDVGFDQELEEPGPGYLESALAKATAVSAATGLTALADDSGIEVDALGGWPGPQSARWMGEAASDIDRLHGLIDEVARRCPEDRRVRYVCVAALARPGADPITARGECLGTLINEPRGTNGFGYDPAFLSADLGMTFAEAPEEAKARVSHRARAIARLAESGALGPVSPG
ncbi:MAG: non-canonical purine NTP pyrophosphatase [Candidatus Dormiibacterota bacterium]